ncbi:MAG TPA: acetate--CoA ligase family protein [Solirubrobacteraceae bacterium]|nr:acetate--CoA ligase family protein [Solirubrobacteraceae bacterium]
MTDLTRLLRPRSVAVVGATDRPGSYGGQTLLNLDAVGFAGPVWGVNPGRTEVLGRPCVPTVSDLPEPVDAVVVAIPAAGVPAAIDAAGARGCGGAVVFSAGFAEVPEGVALQAQLLDAAERHQLPVCGPNCNGIVAMHAPVALWGDALAPREPGAVALISQSGNVAVNALATRRGLRFHTVIASGNQAVLGAADYLSTLAADPAVGAIALYLEDDGGPRLCEGLAACAQTGVRVAVLKVGSSPAGARAAAAHSAALAGDQRIFRALVEEAGAVWAHDVHELLEVVKTLAVPARRPAVSRPGGLAIMTCSGGDSAQGADEAARLGLELPPLAPATRAHLRDVLPSAATVGNPLDYTAMIWGERQLLSDLVCTLGEDAAIDHVLVFYDRPPGLAGAEAESWDAVREGVVGGGLAARHSATTIVCSTLPELLDDEAAWQCIQAGIPAVAGLRTGLACTAALRALPGDAERLREIAAAAGSVARGSELEWLSEHDAKDLLRAASIDVVDGRLVADAGDAALALIELGPTVALKLSSPAIQHKSELGAVWLELSSADEVATAFAHLSELANRLGGAVLAERMAAPGVELIVAARADAVVPALVIGLGGVWTEVLSDVAVVPLPADAARIERALRSLRGAPLLTGARGAAPVDLGAVASLAQRVGELLLEESLELLELNPVLAGPAGAVAVDATARRRIGATRAVAATPAGTVPCTT